MEIGRMDSLNLANKGILITGAAGFIGSNLVEYFARFHPNARILALDFFRDGSSFNNGNPSTLGHYENLLNAQNAALYGIYNQDSTKPINKDASHTLSMTSYTHTDKTQNLDSTKPINKDASQRSNMTSYTQSTQNSMTAHMQNSQNLDSIKPNIEIIPLDINDTNALRKVFYQYGKIDYIFHQAAISDTTCDNMKKVLDSNLSAFKELIRLAMRHESHIIYASSAATYGLTNPPNSVGKNEIPQNIYGYSKLCMDRHNALMQEELQDKGIGLIGLRYFNVYGKNEFYKAKTASMVLQLSLQALINKRVRLFEFGEQKRDFVYINDVIEANIRALELIFLTFGASDDVKHLLEWQKIHKVFNDASMPKEPPLHEQMLRKIYGANFKNLAKELMQKWLNSGAVYNVGSGAARSFNDIIEILKGHFGSFEVEFIKNNYPFFQTHTLADSSDFLPNYKPNYDLESGINDYIPFIKALYSDISQGRKIW